MSCWGLAAIACKASELAQALDRRFFRERYDAQRCYAGSGRSSGRTQLRQVAPRAVTHIETALPGFVALLTREPQEPSYSSLAVAPADKHSRYCRYSKLMSLLRLLGKPIEVPQTATGWLKEQLPHEETAFLRQARIELLVPITTATDRTGPGSAGIEALGRTLYVRTGLLVAITSSLVLLLEKPSETLAERCV
jgi:hypothetical protein